jgi:hypothetical protein
LADEKSTRTTPASAGVCGANAGENRPEKNPPAWDDHASSGVAVRQQVQVDARHAQPLEALSQVERDLVRGESFPVPVVVPALREQQDVRPPPGPPQPRADRPLAAPAAVDVGGVEQVPAALEIGLDDLPGASRIVVRVEAHRAQHHARHRPAETGDRSVPHRPSVRPLRHFRSAGRAPAAPPTAGAAAHAPSGGAA